MHNTGNPIGSDSLLDLYDNSSNIDQYVNSQEDTFPDRFGVKRLTLAGLIKRSMGLRNEINDFSGALTFKPEWSDVPMNVSESIGGEGGALNLQAEALGNRSEINKIHSREALRRTYQEIGLNLVPGSFEEGGTLESTTDILLEEKTGKCYSGPIGNVPKGTDPLSGGFVDKSLTLNHLHGLRFIVTGNFFTGGVAESGKSCLLYNDGFYYTPKSGIINAGKNSAPDINWISVGYASMLKDSHSLFDFGCVDDNGITDNRSGIQLAIEFMEHFKSKLLTDSSKDTNWFGVKTFSQRPLAGSNCIILTKPRNINISGGRNRNSSIKYVGTEPGNSLFMLMAGQEDWGMTIDSLGASAGNKLNHVIDGHDVWYAQSDFNGGCYEDPVLDALHLSCYMSNFKRVFTNNCGRDGIAFGGPDSAGGWTSGTSTSLNLDNCWSRRAVRNGFSVANELWYSNWSSLGCDGATGKVTQKGYDFYNVKGLTLNGIGAEYCEKLLRVRSFRGLIINGIQMSDAGPEIGTTDNCIELVSGFDCTIAGFSPVDAFNSKYTNILHVTAATGNEFVNILDMSIRSDKVTATKATPSGYYRYPEIIYFAISPSKDRGLTRTGNVLSVPPNIGQIASGTTQVSDTVLCRECVIKTTTAVVKELFVQVSGGEFDAVVDITSISGLNTDYTQLFVYRRGDTTSFNRLVGAPVVGWTFSTVNHGCRITTSDTVGRVFFIKIRFISTDSVIEFKV